MFANVTSFAKFAKISSCEHFHAYGKCYGSITVLAFLLAEY